MCRVHGSVPLPVATGPPGTIRKQTQYGRRGASARVADKPIVSAPIDSLQVGMHGSLARPDGLDRMLHMLVDALPRQGVNVRAPGTPLPLARAASDGLAQAPVPAQTGLVGSLLRRVYPGHPGPREAESPRRPDVVALHSAPHATPILGKFGKVPRVVHFHGSWADERYTERGMSLPGVLRYGLERIVYQGGTRLIVQSLDAADLLNIRYRVPEDRIRVVPACVDTSRYAVRGNRRQVRSLLKVPQDRPVVLCVRPLLPGMGLEALVDAIFVVRQRVPDVYVMIVGTGPKERRLSARIDARGLAQHVFLRGFVPDDVLPQYYRAADLTVVPALAMKDCGLTAIESLATGTPVLVTAVGGLAETVMPLCEELVLTSGGYPELAAGISDALLGVRFTPSGDACRRYARKYFDHAIVAATTAGVYRDAIDSF